MRRLLRPVGAVTHQVIARTLGIATVRAKDQVRGATGLRQEKKPGPGLATPHSGRSAMRWSMRKWP
jgi:hypothetical protein